MDAHREDCEAKGQTETMFATCTCDLQEVTLRHVVYELRCVQVSVARGASQRTQSHADYIRDVDILNRGY